MSKHSDGGFHFEDRGEDWTVGVFDVLAGLDSVVHAVTTRRGPVLGGEAMADDPAARRIAGRLGLRGMAYCRQVHGNSVLAVCAGGLAGDADAMITNGVSLGLLGRSADCPLILVADPVSGAVGMAHASWRGTVSRIAARLLAALAAHYQIRPSQTIACICPSAGPCCYEVGPDVVQAARAGMGNGVERFFPTREGKTSFDMWSANAHQLVRAGLPARNVYVSGVCTICNSDVLPSYRVDGAEAGRFAAVIAQR
ncbi:MAG: laccase domain-containing protein [Phycisphaerae bacterium]|nr:laccase domain-containing protein [Phycisphaerae bacterium]